MRDVTQSANAFPVLSDEIPSSIIFRALMFAKLMGPRHFSPELYAHKWIDSGRHSADDTASRKREMDSVPADSYSHISHLFE